MCLSACTGTKAAAPPAAAMPVNAALAEPMDVPVQVRAIGSVEAYSTVSVKTQVTGELTGVYFKEGDDVKKGQLLFTLDKRPFEADVKKQESNLAHDQAQAANARAQQKRYEALVKAGVVSSECVRPVCDSRVRARCSGGIGQGCARECADPVAVLLHLLADQRPHRQPHRASRKHDQSE